MEVSAKDDRKVRELYDELSERLFDKMHPTYRDPIFEKRAVWTKAELEELQTEKMLME